MTRFLNFRYAESGLRESRLITPTCMGVIYPVSLYKVRNDVRLYALEIDVLFPCLPILCAS